MAKYDTQQRHALLEFLKMHPERAFSIEELYSELACSCSGGKVPGKSTLYRLIPLLVSEGLVKRFSGERGRQFQYQIVSCGECQAHLHLKCTSCGCLYHMDHAASEQIIGKVLEQSAFALDQKETVLFGVCQDCQRGKK